ncbi:hypothetical protein VNO78_34687 [Psophocarpus tetragonolobus]|uniref:Uncharacterized protein n=1 Tax=Psophocarpus tetragonolobus TaxID=3891 RepID=A0AAN9RKV1_PSOTE
MLSKYRYFLPQLSVMLCISLHSAIWSVDTFCILKISDGCLFEKCHIFFYLKKKNDVQTCSEPFSPPGVAVARVAATFLAIVCFGITTYFALGYRPF